MCGVNADNLAVKKAAPVPAAVSNVKRSGSNQNSAELKRLQAEVADLNVAIEGLEKERDFYFSKLRDIEVVYILNRSQLINQFIR